MLCNRTDSLQINGIQRVYEFYRSVYAPVESNMYVLIEGKEAIIIDSNVNGEIQNIMKKKGVEKIYLFLTHEHFDHSHGVTWIQENFNTTLFCHRSCEGNLSTKKLCSPRLVAFVMSVKDMSDGGQRYEEFKQEVADYELHPDVFLDDDQRLDIAEHKIRVVHVPGHSPASCIYILDEEIAFSGDAMIEGNKIITAFRGGNKDDMQNITLDKLKMLSDDLWVMPGHGDPFKKKDFDLNIYNV